MDVLTQLPPGGLSPGIHESESEEYDPDYDEDYITDDDEYDGGDEPQGNTSPTTNNPQQSSSVHSQQPSQQDAKFHNALGSSRNALLALITIVSTLMFSLYLSFPAPYQLIPRAQIAQIQSHPYHYQLPIFSIEQQQVVFPSITNPKTYLQPIPAELTASLFWVPNSFSRAYPIAFHNIYRFIQSITPFNLGLHQPLLVKSPLPPNQLVFENDQIDTLYNAIFPQQQTQKTTSSKAIPLTTTTIISPFVNVSTTPETSAAAYGRKQELLSGNHMIPSNNDEILSQVLLLNQQKQQQQNTQPIPLTHTIRLDCSTSFSLYQDLIRFLNSLSIFPAFSTNLEDLYATFLQNLASIVEQSPLRQNDKRDFTIKPGFWSHHDVKIIITLANLSEEVLSTLRDLHYNDYLYKLSLHSHSQTSIQPNPSTPSIPQTIIEQHYNQSHKTINNAISKQRTFAIETTDALSTAPILLPTAIIDQYINYVLLPRDINLYNDLEEMINQCRTEDSTQCHQYYSFLIPVTNKSKPSSSQSSRRQASCVIFQQDPSTLTMISILTRLPKSIFPQEQVQVAIDYIQARHERTLNQSSPSTAHVNLKKVIGSELKGKLELIHDRILQWVREHILPPQHKQHDDLKLQTTDLAHILSTIGKMVLFIENQADIEVMMRLLQSPFYDNNIDNLLLDLFQVMTIIETNSKSMTATTSFHNALVHLSHLIFTTSLNPVVQYEQSQSITHQYTLNSFLSLQLISQLTATSHQSSPSLSTTLGNIQSVIDLIASTAHIHGFIPFSTTNTNLCALNQFSTLHQQAPPIDQFNSNTFYKQLQDLCPKPSDLNQIDYLNLSPHYIKQYQKHQGFKFIASSLSPNQCQADIECIINQFPFLFTTFTGSNPRTTPYQSTSNISSFIRFWSKLFINPTIVENNHIIALRSTFHSFFAPHHLIKQSITSSPTYRWVIDQLPYHKVLTEIISLALLTSSHLPFATTLSALPFATLNGLTSDVNALFVEPLAMEAGFSSSQELMKQAMQGNPDPSVPQTLVHKPHSILYQHEEITQASYFLRNQQLFSSLKQLTPDSLEQNNALISIIRQYNLVDKKTITRDDDLSTETNRYNAQLDDLLATFNNDALELTMSLGAIPGLLSRYNSIPLSMINRNFYGEVQNNLTPFVNNPTPTTVNALALSHLAKVLRGQLHNTSTTPLSTSVVLQQAISKHYLYFFQTNVVSIEETLGSYINSWLAFLPRNVNLSEFKVDTKNTTGILDILPKSNNEKSKNVINIFTITTSKEIYSIITPLLPLQSTLQPSGEMQPKDLFIQYLLTHYDLSDDLQSNNKAQDDKKRQTPSFTTTLTSGLEHLKAIHGFMAKNQLNIARLQWDIDALKRRDKNKAPNATQFDHLIATYQQEVDSLIEINSAFGQYSQNLLSILTQIQIDLLLVLSRGHKFQVPFNIASPEQQHGFYYQQDLIKSGPSTNSILQQTYSQHVPDITLPIIHQYLYTLSSFISHKGLISTDSDHFQLMQKLALKCLFRSRLPSHQIHPSTFTIDYFQHHDPQLIDLFVILYDHLGQGLPITIPLSGSQPSSSSQRPQTLTLFPRVPAQHATSLSFYYQHHLGSSTDTFRVVHNYVTTSNSQSIFLCYLYNTMVSNMLHSGFTDRSDFHRYMDQTVDCWNRNLNQPQPNSLHGAHHQAFTAINRVFFEHSYPGYMAKLAIQRFMGIFTSVSFKPITGINDLVNAQLITSGSLIGTTKIQHPGLQSSFVIRLLSKLLLIPSPVLPPHVSFGDYHVLDLLRNAPTLYSTQAAFVKSFEGLIEYEGLLTFGNLHPLQASSTNQNNNAGSVFFRSPQHKSEIMAAILEGIQAYDTSFNYNDCNIDRLRNLSILFAMLPSPYSDQVQNNHPIATLPNLLQSKPSIFEHQLLDLNRPILKGLECFFGNNDQVIMTTSQSILNLKQHWSVLSAETNRLVSAQYRKQQSMTKSPGDVKNEL